MLMQPPNDDIWHLRKTKNNNTIFYPVLHMFFLNILMHEYPNTHPIGKAINYKESKFINMTRLHDMRSRWGTGGDQVWCCNSDENEIRSRLIQTVSKAPWRGKAMFVQFWRSFIRNGVMCCKEVWNLVRQ